MSKRILIIDDEEHVRWVTALALEAAGYGVGEAADGSAGLQAFGDGSGWDCVILDQRMPGMDGLQVLHQIRERDQGACVVMVTAYASIELAVDAMKLGASDFVRKPMTPDILRNAIAAALSKAVQRGKPKPAAPHLVDVSDELVHPLIQTITMNGFEIMQTREARSFDPGERRFIVRNPRGWEREVIVQIPEEVIAYAERITRRQLPPNNSFWTYRAEHTLANYLWIEGRLPDHDLAVNELSREDLDAAVRWKSNE